MFSRAYRAAITLPPLLWVALFLLLPYALLFCYSFWSVSPAQAIIHSWTLNNYRELFRVNVYLQTLFRSMWIAARVTIFSLLLGYPLAYYLSFGAGARKDFLYRSEEHTSELQSQSNLVCRLLLEKKKNSLLHHDPSHIYPLHAGLTNT